MMTTEPQRFEVPMGTCESGSGPKRTSEFAQGHSIALRIVAKIGSGAKGVVYEAVQMGTGVRLALKFPKGTFPSSGREGYGFKREAATLACIRSPYVVEFRGLVMMIDGTPGLAMELLTGLDLASTLHWNRRLSVRRAVQLVHDACQGIRVVHSAGLIHRDIKPANLFVVHRKNQELCKVIDFGTARSVSESNVRQPWTSGTLRYMAPEQLAGDAALDHRVDLYALASVLYECIAGEVPHQADSLERMIFARIHHEPRRLSGGDVSANLAAVMTKALARHPSQRFSSIDELAEAIEPHCLRGVTRAHWVLRARNAIQRDFLGYCSFADSTHRFPLVSAYPG